MTIALQPRPVWGASPRGGARLVGPTPTRDSRLAFRADIEGLRAVAIVLVVLCSIAGRLLSVGPLRLLGRLSYSWYLWHWPMLVFLRELVPNASLQLRVLVSVAALLPAAATYALVESPIGARLHGHAGRVVAGAAALTLITLGPATAGSEAELPRIHGDGCQVGMHRTASPRCAYGAAAADTTVVLFGDSHAGHWFPALESVAAERGWTLVALTKTGCPSVAVTTMNASLDRAYHECDAWRRHALGRIATERPTIVVVANARSYRVRVGDGAQRTDSTVAGLDAWRTGLTAILAEIRASGATVLVLQDTPRLLVNVPQCLSRRIDEPAGCSGRTEMAIDTVVSNAERNAAGLVPGVSYTLLNAAICDGAVCSAVRDGQVRFLDTNHLTVRFAESLAPDMSRALSEALAAR
jgi:hypothetical protein